MTDFNFPKVQINNYVAVPDATAVSNPFRTVEKEAMKLDELNKKLKAQRLFDAVKATAGENETEAHKSNVHKMIEDEESTPESLDKKKTAETIVEVAQELGLNPVVVASLAKHETGFNQNLNGKTGKGAMQITKVSIQDMYQNGRESFYDPKLAELKKKYKTPEALYAAIQKDPKLNITVGAILFKSKLTKANGNLAKAFESYNGSPRKKQYSKELMAIYNAYNKVNLEA